jgi:hypothetical protein
MTLGLLTTLIEMLSGVGEAGAEYNLSLPFTSSLFYYSRPDYNFSYFHGWEDLRKKSADAKAINDLIRDGYIDTLHAYGDFDGGGGFTRGHAEAVFEELQKNNLKIKIFTNHGGTDNIQNIGQDALYHKGDDPSSQAYHADLMTQNGIQYVWTDSMILQRSTSGNSITSRLKGALLQNKRDLREILHDVQLQDGQKLKGFMRFRSTGENAPNFSSLQHQISQIDWAEYYKQESGLILYQHLGVLSRMAKECTKADIKAVFQRPEAYIAPFVFLSEEKKSGRLWLARLVDFLDYVDIVQTTSVHKNEQGHYILESQINYTNPKNAFRNLTIYVDSTQPVTVLYKDFSLPYIANGPDKTGRYSVTIKE